MFSLRPIKIGSSSFFESAAACLVAASLLSSCGGAATSTTYSGHDKAAVLNAVDMALTRGACDVAILQIAPLYNSASSDNDVRMRAAAAYACQANVSFLTNVITLTSNAGSISATPSALWRLLAKTYNSRSGQDHAVEGAVLSLDALMSIVRPGTLILPQYQVNAGTFNVGSVFYTDRLDDANFAMLFTSMATIGSVLGRYGLANAATGAPSAAPANLPWTAATSFANTSNGADGCALASGVVNFIDSLNSLTTIAPPSMTSTITTITSLFGDAINYSCDAGCRGLDLTNPVNAGHTLKIGWVGNMGAATGCALSAAACQSNGQPSCTVRLRNRASCAGTTTDVTSCQAAGIVNFLKNSLVGWN